MGLKLRFWGVRGSIPVAGPVTAGYGGNTSCIEISSDGGPPVVCDCGTGARELGRELLGRRAEHIEVLFTHFHMDHLFGFPFFGPVYSPNCRINVTVPAYSDVDARDKIGRYLNGLYHPVRLRDIASNMTFSGIRPGRPFELGPYQVTAVRLNHPGGACGYRVEHDGHAVVYLTDTAPLSRPDEGLSADKDPLSGEARVLDAMRGAEAVVMDTMFSFDQYLEHMTWGHSYPEYAVKLAERAEVGTLYLFHHSPDASDEQLDALGEQWADYANLKVRVAREGLSVDLEG